jgi:hypothetical protein
MLSHRSSLLDCVEEIEFGENTFELLTEETFEQSYVPSQGTF